MANMFGALNRFISRLDAADQPQKPGGPGAYGFQVLKNLNTDLPIEPWFDFVIGINGRSIVSGSEQQAHVYMDEHSLTSLVGESRS